MRHCRRKPSMPRPSRSARTLGKEASSDGKAFRFASPRMQRPIIVTEKAVTTKNANLTASALRALGEFQRRRAPSCIQSHTLRRELRHAFRHPDQAPHGVAQRRRFDQPLERGDEPRVGFRYRPTPASGAANPPLRKRLPVGVVFAPTRSRPSRRPRRPRKRRHGSRRAPSFQGRTDRRSTADGDAKARRCRPPEQPDPPIRATADRNLSS